MVGADVEGDVVLCRDGMIKAKTVLRFVVAVGLRGE